MNSLWKLLKKDLESIKHLAIIQGLGIVFWDVFFYSRIGRWPVELIVGPATVPFALVFFWLIIQAIQVYRHEWQTGGIYQTLTLPQPGWKIALAKLVAVMLGFSMNFAIAGLGFYWLMQASGALEVVIVYFDTFGTSVASPEFVKTVLFLGTGYWLGGLQVAVILHGGYNCMRLGTRFRFLLGLSFFTLGWVQNLCAALGYRLFSWLPDMAIKIPLWGAVQQRGPLPGAKETATVLVDSGIVLGSALGLVLIFWLTGYLIENVLEA